MSRTELWEAPKDAPVDGHFAFTVDDDEHVRVPYTLLVTLMQSTGLGLRRKISTPHEPRWSVQPKHAPAPVATPLRTAPSGVQNDRMPPPGYRWMTPAECHRGDTPCRDCAPRLPGAPRRSRVLMSVFTCPARSPETDSICTLYDHPDTHPAGHQSAYVDGSRAVWATTVDDWHRWGISVGIARASMSRRRLGRIHRPKGNAKSARSGTGLTCGARAGSGSGLRGRSGSTSTTPCPCACAATPRPTPTGGTPDAEELHRPRDARGARVGC